MGEPTYFGVRHLSPAAAFHLRRQLDEMEPELVLVEDPSDLSDQMKWLCHRSTQFPAAILAYTKTVPVRTILYPLAIYSPEVQAILWAEEHKIPCRFMDLPSAVFLAMEERQGEENFQSTESVYERIEMLTGEDHDTFWETGDCRGNRQRYPCRENLLCLRCLSCGGAENKQPHDGFGTEKTLQGRQRCHIDALLLLPPFYPQRLRRRQ